MKAVIKNDDTNRSKDISTSDDNDMTYSHQIKSNLIELAKNYDKIMTLINSENNITYDIIIELPVETKDNYRTTIRINSSLGEL